MDEEPARATDPARHILVLQGPNMNRLGQRKPELYGRTTLSDVGAALEQRAEEHECTVAQFQSNHEGELIDWLYDHMDDADGVICNPAGLTNYGLSLRDALAESGLPIAIVHVTNLLSRERWRRDDRFAEVATIYVAGMGWRGYLHVLDALLEFLDE